MLHHRREGQLLTQTQEEMILIAGLGLFWVGKCLFFLWGDLDCGNAFQLCFWPGGHLLKVARVQDERERWELRRAVEKQDSLVVLCPTHVQRTTSIAL
ncbi:hypothetical protein EDD18DRAFT_656303 [Armillaria luteobubalina]|uniref:Uncharacterized protein n=1 Tax=Armillaria luteobubalina TaxID=153913 RepID=A0AA39TG30_9AGAR|nr:hypothetical protein EDD18DRAFT_656303 [Armillaria luteobubalina]